VRPLTTPSPKSRPANSRSSWPSFFSSTTDFVDDLQVTLHEKIEGADGEYNFDATVRFRFGGMDFLVLVEAKRHTNPIKRELVQVLHSKLQSVGAQKAAMISTAPYQRGALKYAMAHGIALATITEGRFVFEMRSAQASTAMTRHEAQERYGLPAFIAHAFHADDDPNAVAITLLTAEDPEAVTRALLGVSPTEEQVQAAEERWFRDLEESDDSPMAPKPPANGSA
jgi:hypothetical protein